MMNKQQYHTNMNTSLHEEN